MSKSPGAPFKFTAAEDVQHALTLIRTGRAALAIPILEQLPGRLESDLIEMAGRARLQAADDLRYHWQRKLRAETERAYREGHLEGRLEGRKEGHRYLAREKPQKPKRTTSTGGARP